MHIHHQYIDTSVDPIYGDIIYLTHGPGIHTIWLDSVPELKDGLEKSLERDGKSRVEDSSTDVQRSRGLFINKVKG